MVPSAEYDRDILLQFRHLYQDLCSEKGLKLEGDTAAEVTQTRQAV